MAARLRHEDVQALYQQHGPALLAYGISLLGERSAAEDVLHHVFLKLLHREMLPEEARPYLFKAVRNNSLNAIRSSERLTSLDGQEWLIRPTGMAEQAMRSKKPCASFHLNNGRSWCCGSGQR